MFLGKGLVHLKRFRNFPILDDDDDDDDDDDFPSCIGLESVTLESY